MMVMIWLMMVLMMCVHVGVYNDDIMMMMMMIMMMMFIRITDTTWVIFVHRIAEDHHSKRTGTCSNNEM